MTERCAPAGANIRVGDLWESSIFVVPLLPLAEPLGVTHRAFQAFHAGTSPRRVAHPFALPPLSRASLHGEFLALTDALPTYGAPHFRWIA